MLFLRREDGQGLAEYALLLALIALVVLLILAVFGQQMGTVYSKIVACLPEPNMVCEF